ncbi:MAG: hypothetical protein KA764_20655 [Anaerolineales bacterium]|nr:hypothetical protein [Anaerolineales bacterium]
MFSQSKHRVLVLKGDGCFEHGLSLLLQQELTGSVLTADYLDPEVWWLMVVGFRPEVIVVNGSGVVDVDSLVASLASLAGLPATVLVVREDINRVTVYAAGQVQEVICAKVADFLALFQDTSMLA